MGTGADLAVESAGVTLVKGDLGGIVRARRLADAAGPNVSNRCGIYFLAVRDFTDPRQIGVNPGDKLVHRNDRIF